MRSLSALETRVIGVEHLPWSATRSMTSSVRLAHGSAIEPVDVGARHGVFGGRGRHLRQPVELAQRFLLHLVGHARGFDLRAQLVDFLGLVVALAELLLDRLHLLAQEVLALALADLGLHLRLNLRAELEDLELLGQDPVELVHARAHVQPSRAAPASTVVPIVLEARRDEVGEPAGVA